MCVTLEMVLDIIILGIIAIFVYRGLSRGLIMSISGLVSLVMGIFGGSYLARTFSGKVGQVLIRPWVHKALNLASEGVQIPADGVVTGEGTLTSSAVESLIGVIESSNLPSFSFEGTFGTIGKLIYETGSEIHAAADVISESIAYIIIFIAAFVIIQILVRILFRVLNLVGKAPVLNAVNRLSGGVLGLISGILLITLVMWFALTFVKPAVEPGAILSDSVISNTYLAKYFDRALDSIFHYGISVCMVRSKDIYDMVLQI